MFALCHLRFNGKRHLIFLHSCQLNYLSPKQHLFIFLPNSFVHERVRFAPAHERARVTVQIEPGKAHLTASRPPGLLERPMGVRQVRSWTFRRRVSIFCLECQEYRIGHARIRTCRVCGDQTPDAPLTPPPGHHESTQIPQLRRQGRRFGVRPYPQRPGGLAQP